MTTRAPQHSVGAREVLPADLAAFAPFRQCLADTLARLSWSAADMFRVLVCADEAVANAVTHCAASDCGVALGYRVSSTRATFSLTNACADAVTISDRDECPDEASEHGRGLLLMRALADTMRVSLRAGSTTVALSFVPHPDEE